MRPKGRGRPQRILLGNWPDEHVRQVIRSVVFRDGTIPSYNHATSFPQPPPSSSGMPDSPRAPAPTPIGRSLSPPGVGPAGGPPQSGPMAAAMNNFLDNNLFAAHLKNLTEHFNKNGGNVNGFLESMPFKALMNEEMHGSARKSMDFEDAEESNSAGTNSRRESFSPPPGMGRVSTIRTL